MHHDSFTQNDASQFSNWIVRDYQLTRKLGEGSYGCVFKAKHLSTKQKVAIKLIATRSLEHRHTVLNEVSILRQLQSDEENHIVHLIDSFEIVPEECPFEMSALPNTEEGSVDTIVCIVTEYIKGDLLAYVQDKGRLRESESAKFFRQLLVAVQWCHEKGVVHRDIKLDNMLLENKHHMKLIDFGLSEYMDQPAPTNFVGSFAYTAPEVFKKKKPYNKAMADVWSCGVVLYTMVTGEFPWEGTTPQEQVKNIMKGRWILPIASPECCDLLKSILQPDPATRFTFADILCHPWMQKHCKELAMPLNSSGERAVATGKQELESPRPRRASFGLGRLQMMKKLEPVVTTSSAAM